MTVKLWKGFSKRINSTAVPAIAATAELACRLKDDTSIHDPVLQLATNEFGYEYAQIGDFGKYYFVRDVVSVGNGLVEYHLTEDPLATYKTEIGNTYAHIAFSSTGYDSNTIDSRITLRNTKNIMTSGGATPGNAYRVFPDSGNGYYILSVFNTSVDASLNGIASTYAVSPSDMATIRDYLCQSNVMAAINTYLHGEPLKAVFNCLWVPYSDFSSPTYTSVYKIAIGNSDNMSPDLTGTFALPSNPKITNTIKVPCNLRYSDFRKSEPYTTGDLYLPGVGSVNLNMSDWVNSDDYIYVEYTIEIITGNMRYFLKKKVGTTYIIVQVHDCCVASPCPLGQMVLNGSGIISGLAGTVGGAASLIAGVATGGSGAIIAGSALALTMGAANTVLAANKRDVMTTGNIGGRMIQTQPYIIHNEYSVNSEDPFNANYIAERGGAYVGTAQISLLSGFIQCEGASINCAASATEKEEINNYLNSGFYYI